MFFAAQALKDRTVLGHPQVISFIKDRYGDSINAS